MNIVDQIISENRGRGQAVAISEGDDPLSYGELFSRVEIWTQRLRDAGVRPLDRVAFLCEDSCDYVCLALAILASGAVVVPISPSLSLHDVQPVMDSMDAAWLLYDADVPAPVSGALLEGPTVHRTFRLAARAAKRTGDDAFARCDPAFIRFSSGTTGASKGVVLSHTAILERTEAANRVLRITESDRILWVLSMSYHFVVTILLFLRRGAQIILCGAEFPAELHRQLAAGAGTFLYGSPFHYNLMAGSSGFTPEMFKSIRMAVATAMPLAPELATRFEERFQLPLHQAYGIIEVGLPFIQSPAEPRTPGSVGKQGQGYEIRILNPDSEGLGEVLLRGPGLFSAYFQPWRTRTELDPEGWFHSGDLGRMDEQGRLFLAGRKREVINFAGMKIFPADVEAVLNRHPCVRESRVYGEPHPRFGQCPVAQIVEGDVPLDERALRRHCYAHLSPYQAPKKFVRVAAIEKTASGKIKR